MKNKSLILLIMHFLFLVFPLICCEECIDWERQSAWMPADQIAFLENGTTYIDTNKGSEQVNIVGYDATSNSYLVESIHKVQ